MKNPDPILSDFSVLTPLTMHWGEMDAFQHLNNVIYFRYFESGRIDYFRKIELMENMRKTGVGPILKSTQCQFKVPLTYPDEVLVGTRVLEVQVDRFLMQHAVFSRSKDKLAALGEALIVYFDYPKSVKADVPSEVRERILEIEKNFKK